MPLRNSLHLSKLCTGFLLILLSLAFGLFFFLLLSHLWFGLHQ